MIIFSRSKFSHEICENLVPQKFQTSYTVYVYYYMMYYRWYFPVLFNFDDHVLDFSSTPYLFKSCVSYQVSLSQNQTME